MAETMFASDICQNDKKVHSESEESGSGRKDSSDVTNSMKPSICVIILGMAGSGKTTLVQSITKYLHDRESPPYLINLDPAVHEVPFPTNIDIRDTVKYKEVMKQYSLGPNGGIVTSLNLFATKFDQVMTFLGKRSSNFRYIIFDTPGQIEVFTWSASGSIITETLASTFPTVIVYVMDTSRSTNPVTFMSNMLYACSILYKYKLPYVVVMNKIDIVSNSFAMEWMTDFESFQEVLRQETSYMSNLTSSLSLVLDEFYSTLKAVGVSAVTGEGLDGLFSAVDEGAEEYQRDYKPQYELLKKKKEEEIKAEQEKQIERLKADIGEGSNLPLEPSITLNSSAKEETPIVLGLGEEESEEFKKEEEEDEEEKKEYDSFKRFLLQQKEKTKNKMV